MNREDLFTDVYRKYLANEMRKAFGYEGCPIVLLPREREKTIEPIRRHNKPGRPEAPAHRTRHGRTSTRQKPSRKGKKRNGRGG